jgi:lipopolysaccharide transport system ATP-binding protein
MSDIAIRAEQISKLYRLGEVGTGSLAHDVNRWWHRLQGKEDPYARVGQIVDRSEKATTEWVWALKDINFTVRKGEVLGIIGRNGAGKSTLLKILSRVTAPTRGTICVKGRIASLLEVGTGFHPELTGRENIFLNGAILGLRRMEILGRFDQIVDFSGCSAYLDTPVRRYSSGMYVRLAFAVGAHLNPDILVVDEVLAVGDVEFQNKCLGKLHELSGQGRTVLLVSHNLSMVSSVCTRGLLLENGRAQAYGTMAETMKAYARGTQSASSGRIDRRGQWLHSVEIRREDNSPANTFAYGETIRIALKIEPPPKMEIRAPQIGIGINSTLGLRIITIGSFFSKTVLPPIKRPIEILCDIPAPRLLPGTYLLKIALSDDATQQQLDVIEDELQLTIEPSDIFGSGKLPTPQQGMVGQDSVWTIF